MLKVVRRGLSDAKLCVSGEKAEWRSSGARVGDLTPGCKLSKALRDGVTGSLVDAGRAGGESGLRRSEATELK